MISIIIVNWNAGEQLSSVIKSIQAYHNSLVERVVIVDNFSSDNSIETIEQITNLPFQLDIIKNKQNNGFGKACNQGAELCSSKYLLFLNPDAELYANTLKEVYSFMEAEKNNKIGVCGVQLIEDDFVVQRSCTYFPTLKSMLAYVLKLNKLSIFNIKSYQMSEWDHASSREVEHLIGAFYFIRNDLFKELNGFDERFFVYLEDLDLSYRVYLAGYSSYYLADAKAFHKGGGTSDQVKAHRLFYSLNSRIKYVKKHFSKKDASIIIFSTLCIEPLLRILFSVMKLSMSDIKNTIKGYKMLWSALFSK